MRMFGKSTIGFKPRCGKVESLSSHPTGISLEPGSRALVMGSCPQGDLQKLVRSAREVIIAAPSAEQLQHARVAWSDAEDHGTFQWFQSDVDDLDFEDGTLDLVVILDLLERTQWRRWTLQNVHRMLSAGGHLILSMPLPADKTFGQKIQQRFAHIAGWLLRQCGLGRYERSISGNNSESDLSSSSVERLGFQFESWIPVSQDSTGRRYPLIFRKTADPAGLQRICDQHRDIFDAERKVRQACLDQWLESHPRYQGVRPEELKVDGFSEQTVLIVSPHPDDELIGCGGTILRLQDAGAKIMLLYLTDGSGSKALKDIPEQKARTIRCDEARRVCQRLGIQQAIFWNKPDGNLRADPETVDAMSALLTQIRPVAVWVPFVADPHPDHQAANRIFRDGLMASSLDLDSLQVFCYEVWSRVPQNRYSVIDRQFHLKTRAILEYRTAMEEVDYVLICQVLNRWDSETIRGKPGYCEVFLHCRASEYVELIVSSSKVSRPGGV